MRGKIKWFIWMMVLVAVKAVAFSQTTVPLELISSEQSTAGTASNLLQYAVHKQLPPGYEQETLEAISHFPELKNVSIRFRVKKSYATLKTRPTLISFFMPRKHRSYVITISNKTIEKLMPLMFANLSTAARIGVIGHELSHVADLSQRTTWQCFKIGIGHLSASYMDRFEYNTDMICIQHGLGKDLEAWSSYIRNTMHTTFWRGADFVNKSNNSHERYMNPATIEKNIDSIGHTAAPLWNQP